MIRTMATRRAGTAETALMLSTMAAATCTYASSCETAAQSKSETHEKNEQQQQQQQQLTLKTVTVSSTDSTERLLEETTLALYKNAHDLQTQLYTSTSNTIQDVRVHAIVATRFLDLMSRSAFAIIDYKLAKLRHSGDDNEDNIDLSAVHERTARSMYEACASHGGVLVKVGQYVATNGGGFIPQVYVDALRPLQDECAPLSFHEVEQVLEQELRQLQKNQTTTSRNTPLWKETFTDIDQTPLGSASLAQVHKATLKNGQQVALKIQRPNLDRTIRADMLALSLLSKAVERVFPGAGFDWMLPEFHKTIVAELDFTQEALNAERCNRMVGGTTVSNGNSLWSLFQSYKSLPKVVIPKPISSLTTPRLLTMSFEEGFRLTDTEKLKENDINSRQVAASACALFAELMMVHGFVHADAHPGNALVRPRLDANNKSTGEFDIVLLDHGMYRRLDETFRSSYSKLWAGLVTGDDARALEGVRGLGFPDEYLDLMGMMLTYRIPSGLTGKGSPFGPQKLGSFGMDKSKRHELRDHLKKKYGDEMFTPSAMNDFMESQSRDLLFCLRCTNLVRGINRDLGGETVDRLIAFGAAASRGTKLSMGKSASPPSASALSKQEANLLTQSNGDILASVKESINQPVLSELHARALKRTDGDVLLPRTLADSIESYNIWFRIYCKGLLFDLLLMLNGKKSIGNGMSLRRI